MKKALIVALVLVLGVGLPLERTRAGSAFAGAMEPTQIANMLELFQQTFTMYQQLESLRQTITYWKQTLASDASPFDKALFLVNGVQGLLGTFQGLLFGGQMSLAQFKASHPGWGPRLTSVEIQYNQLRTANNQAVQNALEVMETQLADSRGGIVAENAFVTEIAEKMRSADGELKAIRVTNELLLELMRQLQKLRAVMMAHAQATGWNMANENQIKMDARDRTRSLTTYQGKHRAADVVNWSDEVFGGAWKLHEQAARQTHFEAAP